VLGLCICQPPPPLFSVGAAVWRRLQAFCARFGQIQAGREDANACTLHLLAHVLHSRQAELPALLGCTCGTRDRDWGPLLGLRMSQRCWSNLRGKHLLGRKQHVSGWLEVGTAVGCHLRREPHRPGPFRGSVRCMRHMIKKGKISPVSEYVVLPGVVSVANVYTQADMLLMPA
jgi:hypothetical protein